jgi:Asp-tRNA(Asn)/Glu-tRNA(Gln) amidotransferase A subunit family amidase
MPPTAICGLWESDVIVNADIHDALYDAATVFAGLGVCVTHSPLIADVDRIVAAHRTIMYFEANAFHGSMLSDARISQLKPKFRNALEAGAAITPAEAAEAAAFLAQANQHFWQRLADVDIVLTLPVPDGAPMIDGTTGFQDWLTPWTVFGGPLICLPWGADSLGRPMSVMLAAHPGKDAELLMTAATLERHCPPLSKPQLPDA